MKLYTYFRSSASYRVRIALNLKGMHYEQVPIHLVHGGQLAPDYRAINADGVVPSLIDDSGAALTQSLAIIEYLEEVNPTPSLLPTTPEERAHVRSLALSIACEIHPLNNLRVLRYLVHTLNVSDADKDAWYRHWCEQGLQALETTIARDGRSGKFCFGDTPTMADCCLIPQLYNARRLNCDLSGMPTLTRIDSHCMTLDAFINASPEKQPDAPAPL